MATQTLSAAIATVSWIDAKVGLPVKDRDPSSFSRRDDFTTDPKFRFPIFWKHSSSWTTGGESCAMVFHRRVGCIADPPSSA